jgi:putative transposase
MKELAFKYRFYPTKEQERLLACTFGCVRFVYNNILSWRKELYNTEKTNTTYNKASSRLTDIKKEISFLNDVSSVPLQQSLRHQQIAFTNFFKKRAKKPKFKSKHANQSVELTSGAFRLKDGLLYIAKCKTPLNIKWHRPPTSQPKTITISKDKSGRYFVSLSCVFTPERKPISNKTIGIDLGIKDIVTTSDGFKSGNHKYTKKYSKKVAKYNRILAKKKKGSCNKNKARLSLAKVHAKVADCRKDFTHKLSSRLVNENQVISCETLQVKNMVKNRKLSKAISDCNWGELIRQLEYKCDWYGRDFVKIDRFFPSSKTCNNCGAVKDKLPLHIREWHCSSCNALLDRDLNASINIKVAGQAILVFGA